MAKINITAIIVGDEIDIEAKQGIQRAADHSRGGGPVFGKDEVSHQK